jgi:hypothetical protein
MNAGDARRSTQISPCCSQAVHRAVDPQALLADIKHRTKLHASSGALTVFNYIRGKHSNTMFTM